ncbi:MAG: AAA family ATPase, partial [Symploca sp. SIO1A3]|nr:AAA family ATPase [Symploca sp. SIO1A3]
MSCTIRAIRCNQASFQEVEFSSGFNVILADRTEESTSKDSRNGLGKSTLIEIIHFCLGATMRTG